MGQSIVTTLNSPFASNELESRAKSSSCTLNSSSYVLLRLIYNLLLIIMDHYGTHHSVITFKIIIFSLYKYEIKIRVNILLECTIIRNNNKQIISQNKLSNRDFKTYSVRTSQILDPRTPHTFSSNLIQHHLHLLLPVTIIVGHRIQQSNVPTIIITARLITTHKENQKR